ncbi:MAG: hypothetical protein QF724_01825 [Planctomycetota bacterium]|jgi:hypothetical protein|nr:hypothetical protein [Planctomycetota bacterium]MDP6519062.1 hypothetical protein [Planctomycetota bacterium]MDP6837652.1 hypothetical protein [Planctomycetota bacterium]MDP6956551.1 hypothetical protein [Planctomycetota bacterium]
MKRILLAAAPLLALAAAPPNTMPQGVPVGSEAPEFTTGKWFNHIGSAPSIASLRGKAILIEFWATW